MSKRIVELIGKPNSNVLFVPTESNDDEVYIAESTEKFGKRLQSQVYILRCIHNHPGEPDIKKKIESADLIYRGGGNYAK
ncbi:Type 1 glutamine amidotransferase-like domain-containing protein [Peribacillus glennii]|uniref:Uncharacterized protein n=1 Tax=Peribacillus glennii TaxID=2303991 RepID=A0A372LHY5_9BACI|nr:hypothetical protein D0466_08635 [Peribacillus glennii]